MKRGFAISLTVLAVVLASASAEQLPSFARDVRPFLTRYCLECHFGKEPDGGLNLETYKSLLAGGDHGPVLVAGKPDASRLVRMVEGKSRPVMPPKNAKQPKADEKSVLRAWISAGAKDDSAATRVSLPDIKPRTTLPAPVTAVAYRPDGKLLVAAGRSKLSLIDPQKGDVIGSLPGLHEKVTAMIFSRDGNHLAVASGSPRTLGEIQIFRLNKQGVPASPPAFRLSAHHDLIHDLAFSPDGKLLASCGYDRLIKLWDLATGKEVRELRDHSDAVYSVAFSADGKWLASGAADRAVKVWDVASGRRLYTLGESTDWVYAVAWSPTGNLLAAAGVDRSIRVWQVTAEGGNIVHSVFAHEGPVNRLVYAPDGRTLYSLSEDRGLKAWDSARMVERTVYPGQPETPLSVAVRPDQKQIAVGRYDGALVLLDEANGKAQTQPLPVKPKPPKLDKITPPAGPRGQGLRLKLEGQNLKDIVDVTTNVPGATAVVNKGATDNRAEAVLTIPANTPAGVYQVSVKAPGGQSSNVAFTVDCFAAVNKDQGHHLLQDAQKITLPATLVGALSRAGEVDCYRFEASAGQEIGIQLVTSAVGSRLDPVLQLQDAQGHMLAESATGNGLLGCICPRAGAYILSIRDREFRGDANMTYRAHVGPLPIVTGIFPLGAPRGAVTEVQLRGVNLGTNKTVRVQAPATAAPGSRVAISLAAVGGAPIGEASAVVGELPEVLESDKVQPIPVPGTANGRIAQPGTGQVWRFAARKGQRLIVETNARRLGSPLDSTIEILDAGGRPLPLATLRSVAKTYVAFRDHDSANTGIRLETWSELAINDFLLVGSELVKIKALPKNPDDDCQFFSGSGGRLGFLGTTPTHHPMGLAMYKVQIHPPGTAFPPNGLPVVTLYQRNDDGGPGYDKDSCLYFDPPADNEYLVRVGDARGQGGPDYAYRLTVRPPRPNFNVSFDPVAPSVSKGDGVSINVKAERVDGFADPIEVRFSNLPPGFTAPPTTIPIDENSTSVTLFAERTVVIPANATPLKLTARAVVDGKEIVREVTGGMPKLVEQGDLLTATDLQEVAVRPGGQAKLTVKIERRNGFKGRVPLEVRGLPHGVRVLDIGLNGILITEKDSSRTVVIYAEPWVKPITHPLVVLSRREGKGTEHAARSVLLRVVEK